MNRAQQWFGAALQDVRYCLRQLRSRPAFTGIAIATLAIGIGANTAIFSMLNGILLRALPYRQPRHLYVINEVVPQWSQFATAFAVNSGNFLLWQHRCPAFSSIALMSPSKAILTGEGRPRQVQTVGISAEFFSTMGVQPQRGRGFFQSEHQQGRDKEVVLSNQAWRSIFDSDPKVLGNAITLNSIRYTVVGVLPPSFTLAGVLPTTPAVFKPLVFTGEDFDAGIGNFNYMAIARLKPRATRRQAVTQLDTVEGEIARRGDALRHIAPGAVNLKAILTPLKVFITNPARKVLSLLIVATALLLVIICANLGNLMLVRNEARLHEVALRIALGSTRWRVVRQLLLEGAIVGVAGAAVGLAIAFWGLNALIGKVPIGLPRADTVRIDGPVLLFTVATSIIAILLFSLLPALRLMHVGCAEMLKTSGPTSSHGKNGARLRSGVVVSEIAISGVLLASSVLLIQSLGHVLRANQWMIQQHVIKVQLLMPPVQARTAMQRYHFYSNVLHKVQLLPGVTGVGIVDKLPLNGHSWGDKIQFREGLQRSKDVTLGDFHFISPGYFRAIGLSLIKGRLLSEGDRDKHVVLISKSVVRRLLGGRDPIGLHLLWSPNQTPVPWRVIGVVQNVRNAPDKLPSLAVYVPYWSFNELNEAVVVRTATSPQVLAADLRRAVWSVNPEVAIPPIETLKSVFEASDAPRRFGTLLVALFAVCSVFLAGLGLFGVISESVSKRTREIGIRMALGATKGDVVGLILREGIYLGAIGTAIGLVFAASIADFLSSFLYEMKPLNPITVIFVVIILMAVTVLASYFPSRRVTHLALTSALRYE